MSTDETASSTGNGKSGPPPAASTPKPTYTLNDSLLMLNSALRYLNRAGVKITLQPSETGVVLTLHNIGVQKKENGATQLVPLAEVPAPPETAPAT